MLAADETVALKRAETVLRRRHHDTQARGERARKLKEARKEALKARKPEGPKSAESIVKEARRRFVDKKRQKRIAKLEAPKLRKPLKEAKVLLVVRNTEEHKSKDTLDVLKTLRLTRRYAAVFCPNEKETLKQLKQIDPFIFYGYPSAGTVRSLLTKRAKVREEAIDDDGNKSVAIIPLSTNLIVEQRFGQEGLLSVEDLVHNIFDCGKTFKKINSELLPFQLESLRKVDGVGAEIRHGLMGNFDELINKIL